MGDTFACAHGNRPLRFPLLCERKGTVSDAMRRVADRALAPENRHDNDDNHGDSVYYRQKNTGTKTAIVTDLPEATRISKRLVQATAALARLSAAHLCLSAQWPRRHPCGHLHVTAGHPTAPAAKEHIPRSGSCIAHSDSHTTTHMRMHPPTKGKGHSHGLSCALVAQA